MSVSEARHRRLLDRRHEQPGVGDCWEPLEQETMAAILLMVAADVERDGVFLVPAFVPSRSPNTLGQFIAPGLGFRDQMVVAPTLGAWVLADPNERIDFRYDVGVVAQSVLNDLARRI